MMKRAGRRNPSVTTAWPGGQPPMARQAACSISAPAARWMAPSTPPPPRRCRLAALTTASTGSVVMSPRAASSRGGTRPTPSVVVVVAPEVEAGTSFSSDTDVFGADSLVFSPQLEKTTVPWMAEEPPVPPGLVTSSSGSAVPLAGR